jgi:transposase
MANFLEYNPEQVFLLPPTVREALGESHLCFFVHGAVEKLDLHELGAGYSEEGASDLSSGAAAEGLAVCLRAGDDQFATVGAAREDLAFRYLAGGAQPDFWTLNEFRKRHG